jgi:F-type H+-transporting ATPase subunit a
MSGIIIVILALVCWLGTRLPRKTPGRLQGMLEMIVGGLNGLVENIVGPGGRKYTPFVGTLFIYIFLMNSWGMIPVMKSPTANLSTTLALALLAIGYVQLQAISTIGLWSYIKHFMGEPIFLAPLMLPLHIIGEIAKPISLSVRLFGNIFGEDTILVILAGMSPYIIFKWLRIIPVQFPMMVFAVFTSLVQALIFSVLTMGYLALLLGEHEAH